MMSKSLWVVLFISVLLIMVVLISDSPERQAVDSLSILSSPSAINKVKIGVSHTGIYRIAIKDMILAGVDASVFIDERIALSTGGKSVPIYMDYSGKSLMFYGLAPSSRYDANRYYILEWGDSPGSMMKEISVEPTRIFDGKGISMTLRLEENRLYISRAVEQVAEPWFWKRLVSGETTAIEFTHPNLSKGGGQVRVALWGATRDENIDPDHRIRVELNGNLLGNVEWDGENAVTSVLAFEEGWLFAGANQLALISTDDTGSLIDQSYLDWIEIDYPPPDKLESGMQFLISTDGRVAPAGSHFIFDVTDPKNPIHLSLLETGNPEQVGSMDAAGKYRIAALSADGGFQPDSIEAMRESNWSDFAQQVDYIIISTTLLMSRLEPLIAAREKQGLNAIIIPIEDIADEFNQGSQAPQSINQFLKKAFSDWKPPAPRFLLLVGGASYDYRDYLGLKPENSVPPFLVSVVYGGETVSDSRLADIDGDEQPDLAVGRWPASSPQEVDALVRRTLAYEELLGQTSPHSLFVADGAEEIFAQMSEDLIQSAGLDSTAIRLYDVTEKMLLETWNQGAWLVNYTGHGSLNLWGRTAMLSLDSVEQLNTAGRPPIVTQLSCLTGMFAHPEKISLAEKMLTMDRGPVAVIAATSLTLSIDQEPFGIALIAALSDPSVETIGEAFLYAQHAPGLMATGGQEVIDTFVLLGDPALNIARP